MEEESIETLKIIRLINNYYIKIEEYQKIYNHA